MDIDSAKYFLLFTVSMAGGFRSKLDQSLDELVEEEITEKEKRKSSTRFSPYPTSSHSNSQAGKSRGTNTNSVYVGNLTYSTTEDELRQLMSKGASKSVFSELTCMLCCITTQPAQFQKLFYSKSQEAPQRYLCGCMCMLVLISYFIVQGCG